MKKLISKLSLVIILITPIIFSSCTQHCNFGAEDWTHFIRKDTAQRWIDNYYAKYQSDSSLGMPNCSTNLLLLGRGDDFKNGKYMMGTMMCKKEVIGFRIYYGIKSNNDSIIPILVGVDTGNNDVYWYRKISPPPDVMSFQGTITEEGAMDMSQKIPPPMSVGQTNMFHE